MSDFPKSFKVFLFSSILVVVFVSIALITNNINNKTTNDDQNYIATMNYFKVNLGMTEEEVLQYFSDKGEKFEALSSSEEVYEKYQYLQYKEADIEDKYKKTFGNINESIEDRENSNVLIVSYNIKNGKSNKELANIIEKYKNSYNNNIYSYSYEGLKSAINYYTIFNEHYKTNNIPTKDNEQGIGVDYDFDGHILTDFNIDIPQVFIVKDGKLNIEETKKLDNKIPMINVEEKATGGYLE